MTGAFISFEGPDGAGKTTQIRLLGDRLSTMGYKVVSTREPGGTLLGDAIRALLLDPACAAMTSRTEALLYVAARAQHVGELIRPALARGEIVLTDRFTDSTMVYQGFGRRLPHAELAAINHFATDGLKPGLTILLDGDPDALRARIAGRGLSDRIELEGDRFQRLVRQGFLEIAAAEPERVRVVESARATGEIHADVFRIVREYLNGRATA